MTHDTEVIAKDVSCILCGYNLRTLRTDGRCPECGKPVWDTLSVLSCPLCGKDLEYRWLRKKLSAKSIHGIVVCPSCRDKFANRRQAAYLVDAVLWWSVLSGLFRALGMVIMAGAPPQPSFRSPPLLGVPLTSVVLPFLFTLKDGFGGYSPGKALFGVQVVDRTTREPIGFVQSCKRNLILMIPSLIGVVLVILTMMKGRRLGDGWANTDVIWTKYAFRTPFDPRGIYCTTCGYNLTGNVSGICPECGQPIVAQPPIIPERRR